MREELGGSKCFTLLKPMHVLVGCNIFNDMMDRKWFQYNTKPLILFPQEFFNLVFNFALVRLGIGLGCHLTTAPVREGDLDTLF